MAMVSTGVRGDVLSSIKYFTKLEVVHFYDSVPYSDVYPEELENLVHYTNFFDLCSKIKKCDPDIIQGSEPYNFPGTLQACAASFSMSKILGVPLFFPMLENRPPKARFGRLSPFLKMYLEVYSTRAKFIIYMNNGARRNLLDVGVPESKLERAMWGCWGVDIDKFTPKKNGLEPNLGRSILFVGRLSEDKGIQYLLTAFKKVSAAIKGVSLVIIGDGPLRGRIRGNDTNIAMLGKIKNQDLPPYFRAADLTVAPSITTMKWEEQIGMVNIQSMACGTPVVSTYSGAIPEYVVHGKTGILVPEKDAGSLADAMIKLLRNNGLKEELGKNAREYAIENFDAKKNIEANERIVLSRWNDE